MSAADLYTFGGYLISFFVIGYTSGYTMRAFIRVISIAAR